MKGSSPMISVVMPCYNEAEFIKNSIESLIDKFFLKNCELIVVDGMSKDGTRNIVKSFIRAGLPVSLLNNKERFQAYGLNLGISRAKGKIVIRTDAHCLYPNEYIKRCVELLKKTKASNVGGMMFPKGTSIVQKAIAMAMQHPVGVGDAKFHLGSFTGYVDTVFLGTFWKQLFDEIGHYDVNSNPNEDAELNIRILKAGKKIYLDSSIKVIYFPRESLKELALQYFRYGRGRCYTTLKHKRITSFRQIGPVVLILSIFLSIMLSLWQPLFLLFPLFYLFAVFLTSLWSWPKKCHGLKLRLLIGLAFCVMHISWGAGFLSGFMYQKKSK